MHTFIVTGCAGFIGSHLSQSLLDEGHSVVGIDRLSNYYDVRLKTINLASLDHPRFTFVHSDILEVPARTWKLSDGIFHLAAQAGVRASWGPEFRNYVDDNIRATQWILESMEFGQRLVYASSSSVYGDSDHFPLTEIAAISPISPYGVSKATCEQLASAYSATRNISTAGLRYFTVYGPRQRPDMAFTRIGSSLLSGTNFTMLGDGTQTRDFTYVEDAVSATLLAMWDSRIGVFNVSSGQQASLNEAISMFEFHSGRRLAVSREGVAAGDVKRTSGDTSLLRSTTGWRPRTDLADGILHHWKWLVSTKGMNLYAG